MTKLVVCHYLFKLSIQHECFSDLVAPMVRMTLSVSGFQNTYDRNKNDERVLVRHLKDKFGFLKVYTLTCHMCEIIPPIYTDSILTQVSRLPLASHDP